MTIELIQIVQKTHSCESNCQHLCDKTYFTFSMVCLKDDNIICTFPGLRNAMNIAKWSCANSSLFAQSRNDFKS